MNSSGPGSMLGFALALCVLNGGCVVETLEPDVGEVRAGLCAPLDSDPEHDVSFEDDIQPLFERPFGQGGCSCHLPTSRRTSGIDATGLRLDDYSGVTQGSDDDDDVVIPGDPCGSLLVQKVSSAPPTGSRMPPDGPPYLSPSEQALIRDWILEGAHDN